MQFVLVVRPNYIEFSCIRDCEKGWF